MKNLLFAVTLATATAGPALTADKPNIVFIYADDLGYGDVSCYGGTRVSTPHIDSLARDGLRFTDSHSSAATCTPSRFSLLTGRYAFRQQGTGILPGDAAMIIRPGTVTLPSVLQQAGYTTGVVGKWHLGLGEGAVDWNQPVKPGPMEIGFNTSWIMAATGDRVPCVYLDGWNVAGADPADPITVSYGKPIPGLPTGKTNPELLRVQPSHGHDQAIVNGISRIGHMSGGKAALWVDESMADRFTGHAVSFIGENRDKPFFLYFATHDIHVPRAPHERFAGKSQTGVRGDVILQLDDCVGRILDTLTKHGLNEKTLVIFTSDNGPVVDDGYRDGAVKALGDHKPAGPFRGGKYSLFEGGTRVPFLVRWPGRVKPGTSAALVNQVDMLATIAALTGQPVPAGAAPDSQNLLPALLGESATGRSESVHHANRTALRQGNWKYIPAGKGPRRNDSTNTELGNDPGGQLYDLSTDPGETKNLAAENPDKAREMAAALEAIVAK